MTVGGGFLARCSLQRLYETVCSLQVADRHSAVLPFLRSHLPRPFLSTILPRSIVRGFNLDAAFVEQLHKEVMPCLRNANLVLVRNDVI